MSFVERIVCATIYCARIVCVERESFFGLVCFAHLHILCISFFLYSFSLPTMRSYELVPTSKTNNNSNSNTNEHNMNDEDDSTNNDEQHHHAKNTCSQFTLRRMACFGSPRYDRREPLHILSADSRFPDVEPKRIRRVGNHFLALFPVTKSYGVGGGLNQFRNHALLRGGSRIVPTTTTPITDEMNDEEENVRKTQKKAYRKWDGGRGRWANKNNNNEAEKQ